MSFKEGFNNELKKLSTMKFKDKADYIWEYYKFWIIGFVVLAVLTYNVVAAQIENSKETLINITMINSDLVSAGETTLLEDFADYMNVDLDDRKAIIDVSMRMTPEMDDEFSLNCSAKIFAQFAANTIDVTIMDKDMLSFYDKIDAFSKLDELVSPEFYEKHKDSFVTGVDSEGNEYICAIDISDSEIFKRSNAYSGKAYLSIISNSLYADNSVAFLEYLYSEN